MTTPIQKQPGIPPVSTNLKPTVEATRSMVNLLSGAVGPNMQRAVRVCELVDAGVLVLQEDGSLSSGTGAASVFVRTSGDFMSGPIVQNNGKVFLRTVAGAKLQSGPAGNTLAVTAAVPGTAAFAASDSNGNNLLVVGPTSNLSFLNLNINNSAAGATTSEIVIDRATVQNTIGSSSSGAQGFVGTRSNHPLVFYTNGNPRGTLTEAGVMSWNGPSWSYGAIGGVGFNPATADLDKAAIRAAGAFGGGITMHDSTLRAGWWTDGVLSGSMVWGLGPSTGMSALMRLTLSPFERLRVEGAIRTFGSAAALYFHDRTSTREWAWYATGDTVYMWNGTANIMTGTTGGVFTAVQFTSTSDRRLKKNLRKVAPRAELAQLELSRWDWKADDAPGIGPVAQDLQEIAPEYVYNVNGQLSVDKAGLALELALLALRRKP